MLEIPAIRWGKPYESLESTEVIHFDSGESIAKIGQVGGGIVSRDLRAAQRARDVLKQFSCRDLIQRLGQAAHFFENDSLDIGNGRQTPIDFVHQQSASTGLPEHMCRANMQKNCFVLRNMERILEALTRGLDLDIISRGFGTEQRGVVVSYQAQSPVLGAVLPNNSPGVHTLWLPVVPLQIGLVLKPGSQEPWTAYRFAAAAIKSGIPAEAISLYPGGHDVGQAILSGCSRSMIFGSSQTVAQYANDPRVQVHGPGFSKIFFGDDCIDDWRDQFDLMIESVLSNGGRSCINTSSIWVSRNGREIAEALAQELGPVDVRPPTDPEAKLAAFTIAGMGASIWKMLADDLRESGVTDCTSRYGPRLVERERCSYLRPVVCHADSPQRAIVGKEFMFPLVTVVECPQATMISSAGPTLVCTAITNNEEWIARLVDAVNIDRLNIGPIPTNRLNWMQPHEGNLIDFLFRSRAVQLGPAERVTPSLATT